MLRRAVGTVKKYFKFLQKYFLTQDTENQLVINFNYVNYKKLQKYIKKTFGNH